MKASVDNPELREFFRWYFSHEGLLMLMPESPLKMLVNSTELVLYRKGQLQVELIMIRKNMQVPLHTHPNVDTYEVPMSGEGGEAIIGGRTITSAHAERARIVPLKADMPHSGGTGGRDGSALSVQYWRNNVPPTFITDDWVGEAWA